MTEPESRPSDFETEPLTPNETETVKYECRTMIRHALNRLNNMTNYDSMDVHFDRIQQALDILFTLRELSPEDM